MTGQIIESVMGLQDPDCEFVFYRVGYADVTNIVARDQSLGTYGILWIDIYMRNESEPAYSLNAATGVTEIGYKTKPFLTLESNKG